MWERNAVMALAMIAFACTPPSTPAANGRTDVAAPVPTHVLTLRDAGTTTRAEQGDFVEIRLEEPPAAGTWRIANRSGDARMEGEGADRVLQHETGPIRVFRLRAVSAGQSQLTFASYAPGSEKPIRVVDFIVAVR